MLTRRAVARRRLPAHRLAQLTPSHIPLRCSATHCRPSNAGGQLLTARHELRPWKSRGVRGLLDLRSERSLATALDDFRQSTDIPFENLPGHLQPAYPSPQQPPPYEMRPFDASFPLVVPEQPPKYPRQRINQSGIPGDVEEMISVFNACLQVGKLDRAELVLKRFASIGALAPTDLMALHNQYLRAKLEGIVASPHLNKAEDVHRWYELQIHSRDLPQTPETIAYMVKASLLTTLGSRLERLVTRYMGMAPGDAGLEVLYMSDILTDQDIAKVTELCPTYNLLQDGLVSPLMSGEDEAAASAGITQAGEEPTANGVTAPEVLSTPQKGVGLKVLKQTLSLFSEIPSGRDISALPSAERREIQSRLERDCVAAAVERWRDENQQLLKMGLNTSLSVASLNSRLYDWHRALEARLAKEVEAIDAAEAAERKSAEDLDRCVYGPFLRQSTPSRLAAVTILSTLSSLAMHGADRGVPLAVVINQLSRVVEEDIRTQQREKEKTQTAARRRKAKRLPEDKNPPQHLESSSSTETKRANAAPSPRVESSGGTAELKDQSWPLAIRAKVGAALLSGLIRTARINVVKEDVETKQLIAQLQPAFSHANQFRRGKKVGMILPNRTLVELMRREPRGDFLARHLPMVVEPEPWSKFDKGGFLESPTSLVRVKPGEKDQRIYTEAALARGDMDQVLKGLDVLGKTAWRINKPVFDVLLEAWNTGDAIADIPPLHPDIPIPPEPASSEDPAQRSIWIRTVKAAENEKSGLHSVRCFINFQLEIARAFRDQTFYFPHNIDFRGRAYPIPTYLNHMGADHVRGLMSFAEGKALGTRGLKWLKIHLANVYGYDKASLTDRESFTADNLDQIIESATNPLNGSRWWLRAEDPWQCLAACFELKAALDSPDAEQFVSHLPVHQDGTCNGLQHYAALGGDAWGAKQVNLEPGDRPADVYTAVADLVKENMAQDLAQGSLFAKALDGKVTRKVVKQTVMTNVYGVTFAGAKKQVLKQLDALYPNMHSETGYDPHLLASYIATKIFKAMSTMFRGAHDIQYWLGEIGSRVCRALTPEQLGRIAKDLPMEKKARTAKAKAKPKTSTDELLSQFRSTIVWTTPLRMPVVQPYRKSGTRVISTCLQSLVLATPEPSDPVHRRKQLQAFPPNFIHSLDASHMILCALECEARGLTFAAVHDSFWTHAGDVDTMNHVLRDSFIRIHREDVIARLAAEFEARYKGSIYLAKVNKGTEVEKRITAHRKKAGLSLKDELLLEKRRLELLHSVDAEAVEKGKKMVTPGALFEQMAEGPNAEALIETEDMEEFALGSIPAKEDLPLAATATAAVLADAETADIHHNDPDAELDAPSETEAEADSLAAEEAEAETAQTPEDRLRSLIGTTHFEVQITKPRGSSTPAKDAKKTIQIWLPLTFPAVPEKGSFDVRRLKASEYFFS